MFLVEVCSIQHLGHTYNTKKAHCLYDIRISDGGSLLYRTALSREAAVQSSDVTDLRADTMWAAATCRRGRNVRRRCRTPLSSSSALP